MTVSGINIPKNLCDCRTCKTIARLKEQGIPEKVIDGLVKKLDVLYASHEIHPPKGEDKAAYCERMYIHDLNNLVQRWLNLRDMAETMIEAGAISDDEFMDAVIDPNPVKSANLVQRIKDYAARTKD